MQSVTQLACVCVYLLVLVHCVCVYVCVCVHTCVHACVSLAETLKSKQTRSTDEAVDKQCRVRIIPASVPVCYRTTAFFTKAIRSSDELEKKPKSSRETVQLAAGGSKSCACTEGNPSTNWCGRATQL